MGKGYHFLGHLEIPLIFHPNQNAAWLGKKKQNQVHHNIRNHHVSNEKTLLLSIMLVG